jgi:hypothetical protein
VKKSIFETLDGAPAQILVVAGLALVLFEPLIPQFKMGAVNSARSAYDNAEAMIELDMEDIKREQERQAKPPASMNMTGMTFEQQQAENQQRQAKLAELQRVSDEKREALMKRYDRTVLKRNLLVAQRDAAGMRWHLVIGWLGSIALIVGLLTLTVRADGMQQKVFLIILLIVLFGALSGVRLDFLAAGQMGGDSSNSFVDGMRSAVRR